MGRSNATCPEGGLPEGGIKSVEEVASLRVFSFKAGVDGKGLNRPPFAKAMADKQDAKLGLLLNV